VSTPVGPDEKNRQRIFDDRAHSNFCTIASRFIRRDWNGWAPRAAVDYALTENRRTLHAGERSTTILPNLWQDKFGRRIAGCGAAAA